MFNGKRILGIIPARGGSIGLPRKNIILFNGKPMIAYSIEKMLSIVGIDKVIVSTDDDEISCIAKQFGAEVPFLRSKDLAQSDTPMVPVILDAIAKMQHEHGFYDYAVMTQANSPLTKAEDICSVLDKIINEDLDVVFTVSEMPHPPQWTLKIENGQPFFAFVDIQDIIGDRRQDQSILYRSTGAIYAVSIKYLLNNTTSARLCLPAPNQKSGVVITDWYSSVDIDSELDFYIGEAIARTKKGQDEKEN